jgi:hypothetical protein
MKHPSTIPPTQPSCDDDAWLRETRPCIVARPQMPGLVMAALLCLTALGQPAVAAEVGDPAVAVEDGRPGHGGSVFGRVRLTAADGTVVAGQGVQVSLTCEPGDFEQLGHSDEHGAFSFSGVPVGRCTLATDLQGFRARKIAIAVDGRRQVQLQLEPEPIYAGVLVTGEESAAPPVEHLPLQDLNGDRPTCEAGEEGEP